MSHVTEIHPGAEVVTATLHQTVVPDYPTSYVGPVHIGYYPIDMDDAPNTLGLWLEQEGQRVNVQAWQLAGLIKQLKRAKLIGEQPK